MDMTEQWLLEFYSHYEDGTLESFCEELCNLDFFSDELVEAVELLDEEDLIVLEESPLEDDYCDFIATLQEGLISKLADKMAEHIANRAIGRYYKDRDRADARQAKQLKKEAAKEAKYKAVETFNKEKKAAKEGAKNNDAKKAVQAIKDYTAHTGLKGLLAKHAAKKEAAANAHKEIDEAREKRHEAIMKEKEKAQASINKAKAKRREKARAVREERAAKREAARKAAEEAKTAKTTSKNDDKEKEHRAAVASYIKNVNKPLKPTSTKKETKTTKETVNASFEYSDYDLYVMLDENGYEPSNKNLDDLKEGLETDKYLILSCDDIVLVENANSDINYMQLLESNDFESDEENIEILKDLISKNRILFK
mgnify:CR=1 FL=1